VWAGAVELWPGWCRHAIDQVGSAGGRRDSSGVVIVGAGREKALHGHVLSGHWGPGAEFAGIGLSIVLDGLLLVPLS